ncbi:MAG: hypothetical protein RL748_1500, partial [Pseudomonadota bacterium]
MRPFPPFAQPLLLSMLVASACQVMAAERYDLERNPAPAPASLSTQTASHAMLGLQASELRELRQQKYANGKLVTRYQQMHQGIPIWGEAITRHAQGNGLGNGLSSNPAQFTGALLRQLSQDLPSVTPAYSTSQIVQLAKTRARVNGPTSNEQAQLYVRMDEQQVARLVYVVSFLTAVPGSQTPTRPFFMIDANTGVVLDQAEG